MKYRIGYQKKRDGRGRWAYVDVDVTDMAEAIMVLHSIAKSDTVEALNCREAGENNDSTDTENTSETAE